MKSDDGLKLERLFKAARNAPARAIEPMPAFLQTRVLAQISSGSSAKDWFFSLAGALRLGVGLAFAIMLGCVAWSYRDLSLQPNNDVELVNVQAHLDSQL